MKSTVALNIVPRGSRMTGNIISEEFILSMDHSIIKVFDKEEIYNLRRNIKKDAVQRIRLQRIEIFRLYSMVKSTLYMIEITIQHFY